MKSKCLRAVVVLAGALIGTMLAAAQSDQSLIANVPFTFSVQQEQFSAGRYVVESLQQGYLRLRSSDNRSVILHVTPNYSRENRGPKGKLVFWRYGSDYFLREAWIPSADFGMNFDQSQTLVAKRKNQKVLVAVQGR